MKARIFVVATAAVLSSCNQAAKQQPTNSERPASAVDRDLPPIPPPGTGPDARTPLGEPNHAVDPKSIEAAGLVVQRFGALIQHNRLDEAAKLWASTEKAASFTKQLSPSTHLEIGGLGEPEGAAGSIYTTASVVFTNGTIRRRALIILRRVNDVPGSTDEQRHWHIERIDLRGPA
jgi:hypothetical protein